MKSISKFISLALLIAAATACNTKEIDKPDIPDQPQISGNVRFTASMKQTRVEYSVNGDALHQRWEEDDVIYGFYGDNPVGKVTLKVTEVDEDTEYATLEATDAEEGAEFIAAIKEKGTDLQVGLLYTGRNDESVYKNTIYVSMQNQSTTGKIPAYLVGKLDKIVKDEESGDTFVYFDFDNECAILEIQSLTGIAECDGLPEKIDLASIQVGGVDLITSFEYSNGFNKVTDSAYPVTVSGQLKADSNGNIIDAAGNRSCIRIAVNATSSYSTTSTEITVTATAKDASSTQYSSKYKGVLHPGCYIICAKDVVAKTEDGFYFTSVSGAFDHAKQLKDTYDSEETNIVTLVQDCGLAGVTKQDGSYVSNIGGNTPISISDYDVTFDLNGHILTLDNYESFNVSAGKTFIIKDSSDDKGIIQSNYTDKVGYHLICNYGTVQIEGGQLRHNKDWSAVRNYQKSTLVVNGGVLYSGGYFAIDNRDASVTINKGNISSGYAVINNEGELTINGGTISSESAYNIIENSDCLNINGGKVYSSGTGSAIMSNGGTVTITGGVIGSNALLSEAIQVLGGTECTISGGVIYSLGEQACAIGCRSEKGGNPELTILPKASSYEPVIYSAGVYPTTFPISAYMGGGNYAKIIIKGGCLISNSTYKAFYSDDEGSNLILGKTDTDFNFGGFYSNMSGICMAGSDISGKTYDLSVNGGVGLPKKEEGDQKYGAILQTDDDLISAIEEILEDGTGKEVSISNIYLIHAVTSISE